MQTLSEPPGPGPAPGAPFGFGHLLSAICQAQDIVDNGGFTIAIPGDKRCPLGDVEKKKPWCFCQQVLLRFWMRESRTSSGNSMVFHGSLQQA